MLADTSATAKEAFMCCAERHGSFKEEDSFQLINIPRNLSTLLFSDQFNFYRLDT